MTLIVTLSTIPPRFGRIGPTLGCLLAQRRPADRILLYIPEIYRRYPDWDGHLPAVPAGVEIRRVAEDFGPATKVLPAAREFAGRDCRLLFCDDDRAYPPDWSERLLRAAEAHPGAAVAALGFEAATVGGGAGPREAQPRAVRRWRITDAEFHARVLWRRWRQGAAAPDPGRRVYRRSGHVDIFEGCGGVVVRPGFFDAEAFRIPDLARTVDDVWLSGMLARRGIPIWLEANLREPENTAAEPFDPLVTSDLGGIPRAEANRRAVNHLRERYGLWP